MGQSTISTHLSQLKQAGLVEDRRTGKSSLYRLSPADGSPLDQILAEAKIRNPRSRTDQPPCAASFANARTRCAPSLTP
jgi:DNA-binding transcriptional ArsR family regulator